MNAETLLKHFDRISDAPDAIPRLRRFILDLAVRGKLVEQDPNDEPAVELLKRIQAEKARLVKEAKIKKAQPLLPVEIEYYPFQLPTNWLWSRLGEVGDWGSGSTPPRGNSDYYGNDVAWLKSGELGDSMSLSGSEERVTSLALEKCSFRLNKPGDILIAMYGATIGKLAILAEPAVTNQAVCGCTPFSGVFNKYLFLFLLSRREDFHGQSEGGAQPNISKVKIVTSPFALPPLAEQHRIVAKVDELMALCDQLETERNKREARRDRLVASSLNRISTSTAEEAKEATRFHLDNLPRLTTRIEHIKQLRQTILNLAVRGRLVPQDPDDEPAAELLKLIQVEKARLVKEGKIRKQNELQVISVKDQVYDAPTGWFWARLGNISSKIHYGYTASANQTLQDVRMLRITDIQNNTVDWSTVPGCEISTEEATQYKLEKSDILIARTGGTIGKTFLVDKQPPVTSIFASYLIRVQGSSKIFDRYLKLFLESPVYWTQLQDGTRGAGQPNVNGQTLGKMHVPLPPLAEQHRIVAKVDELMAMCDQMETQLTTTEADSRRLLEAVLRDALDTNMSTFEASLDDMKQ